MPQDEVVGVALLLLGRDGCFELVLLDRLSILKGFFFFRRESGVDTNFRMIFRVLKGVLIRPLFSGVVFFRGDWGLGDDRDFLCRRISFLDPIILKVGVMRCFILCG